MNREPRRPVAVEEVAAFERDGVVLLRGLLDEAWIELLADAIERDIADPGPGFHGYASEDGGRKVESRVQRDEIIWGKNTLSGTQAPGGSPRQPPDND